LISTGCIAAPKRFLPALSRHLKAAPGVAKSRDIASRHDGKQLRPGVVVILVSLILKKMKPVFASGQRDRIVRLKGVFRLWCLKDALNTAGKL
jgi:hypothetical protein